MRIAFTSCFSAALFRKQPVWTEIANAQPDILVLLGDAIYLDCSGGLTPDGSNPLNEAGLQTLNAADFAKHAHLLYQKQLQQPEFKAMLAKLGAEKVFAIWDDHDFLWNDAQGADVMGNVTQRDLVFPSRAAFAAWCDAIAGKTPFPATPPQWGPQTTEPGYRHVNLGGDVHLHLTDGRSYRRAHGKALLGMGQLQAIEANMNAAPGATHLLASGTVIEQRAGESWARCEAEYDFLLKRLAQKHNILVLSGDIHDNNLAAYRIGQRNLFEATASGAAIKTLVNIGSLQRNYGLLDIDAGNVHIQLFKSNTVPQYRGTIDRQHWT